MWKYGDRSIVPGKSWVDSTGVRHPSNWHIWSDEEKTRLGIKEVTPEKLPDSRLYSWTVDSDGKIQNKKARELDDSGSGESKVLDMMEAYEEVGIPDFDTVEQGLAGDVPSELSGREYIERARQARASEAEQQAALAAQIALAKEGTQLAKGEGRTPEGNPFGGIASFIFGEKAHPFGRHSSDFGIPDDGGYRDVTFGDAMMMLFGLTGPIGQIKAYRMAQRANPHDARTNEMKYQDPAKMQYGRPEMYGVRQDTVIPMDEAFHPNRQPPLAQPADAVTEEDFFIDDPSTPAVGNIFNYSSQFQGFHSDPTRAGFVGQHSFFLQLLHKQEV